MTLDRRYWDSNVFIDWLSEANPNQEKCKGIIQRAEAGKIEIITSALTIAEVLFVKGGKKIPKEKSEHIIDYFKNNYIKIVNLDRYISEYGRSLVWDFNIKPKDAIHVASAIWSRTPKFDTFDGPLIKKNGKIGNPPLIICEPDIPYQDEMFKEDSNDEEGPKGEAKDKE